MKRIAVDEKTSFQVIKTFSSIATSRSSAIRLSYSR